MKNYLHWGLTGILLIATVVLGFNTNNIVTTNKELKTKNEKLESSQKEIVDENTQKAEDVEPVSFSIKECVLENGKEVTTEWFQTCNKIINYGTEKYVLSFVTYLNDDENKVYTSFKINDVELKDIVKPAVTHTLPWKLNIDNEKIEIQYSGSDIASNWQYIFSKDLKLISKKNYSEEESSKIFY